MYVSARCVTLQIVYQETKTVFLVTIGATHGLYLKFTMTEAVRLGWSIFPTVNYRDNGK